MSSTLESKIAQLFAMSDETWARHANPWSVWTRFTALPLMMAAVWSRVWLSGWAWGPVVLSLLWTWFNPRVFRRPSSTDNWASMAVLGERVWLHRKVVPVPPYHRAVPNLLSGLALMGLPFIVWGLCTLEIWPSLVALLLTYAGKVWFLDRMVWLFRDMKDLDPEYAEWHYENVPPIAARP